MTSAARSAMLRLSAADLGELSAQRVESVGGMVERKFLEYVERGTIGDHVGPFSGTCGEGRSTEAHTDSYARLLVCAPTLPIPSVPLTYFLSRLFLRDLTAKSSQTRRNARVSQIGTIRNKHPLTTRASRIIWWPGYYWC